MILDNVSTINRQIPRADNSQKLSEDTRWLVMLLLAMAFRNFFSADNSCGQDWKWWGYVSIQYL